MGFARNTLLADFHHHGNGERRYPVELLVDDVTLDSCQHIGKAANVEKPGGGIGARGLDENVVGFMRAQDVIDEIGRDGYLPPGL